MVAWRDSGENRLLAFKSRAIATHAGCYPFDLARDTIRYSIILPVVAAPRKLVDTPIFEGVARSDRFDNLLEGVGGRRTRGHGKNGGEGEGRGEEDSDS